MRIGLDANVLICAHMPALSAHEPVRRFLTRELRKPDVRLVVTPLVLHEFIHIVTDERRFDPPVQMSEAIAIARLYLNRSNVQCVPITEPATARALQLIEQHHLGRKRIADTLLVATLLENEVFRLATFNAKDFAIFEDVELIDPRG